MNLCQRNMMLLKFKLQDNIQMVKKDFFNQLYAEQYYASSSGGTRTSHAYQYKSIKKSTPNIFSQYRLVPTSHFQIWGEMHVTFTP